MLLKTIIREINNRARCHPVGKLQEIRKEAKRLSRVPGNEIFHPKSTFEKYAYHFGGRKELQFNVGFEDEDGAQLRHGVAFCFDKGRNLPEPLILIPKVRRFNTFLRSNPNAFPHLKMWRWINDGPTPKSRPAPIESSSKELVEGSPFIFLGRTQATRKIDYELILADLDCLLPLYEFVEGPRARGSLEHHLEPMGFNFKPGSGNKVTRTTASIAAQHHTVVLRENRLQSALRDYLASIYGSENVSKEQKISTIRGRLDRADVMVRCGDTYWLYEAKAHVNDRACIRDALGQLLEYSFWPGNQGATKLFVVAEAALTPEGAQYLKLLKCRFRIPIEYRQFNLAARKFVEAKS